MATIWGVMLTKRRWAPYAQKKEKKMGSKKILQNWQMGCKLLEIMADGLYVVFHRFEADLCAYYRLTRMLS